jgi:hypothetical protein
MGSCYLISAICLHEKDTHPDETKPLGAATTSMFFLYYFFYGTSYAKVPWVYNSEINSLGWRSRGAAAATATNWMGSFIVTQFTKVGVDNLGWRFYLSKYHLFNTQMLTNILQCSQSSAMRSSPPSTSCTPRHLGVHSKTWTRSSSRDQASLSLETRHLHRETDHMCL